MRFDTCSYSALIFYENSSRLVEVHLNRIVQRISLKLMFAETVRKCRLVSEEAAKVIFSFCFVIFFYVLESS